VETLQDLLAFDVARVAPPQSTLLRRLSTLARLSLQLSLVVIPVAVLGGLVLD